MSSICKQIEVQKDDDTPNKWSVPLSEEVFKKFLLVQENNKNLTVQKIFGEGSLFSPMLFGKFFDPCDAFPLWEFESEVLLANLRSCGKTHVDWFQTDDAYVLKADVPHGKSTIQVYVDNGKIVEISGQRKQQTTNKDPKIRDWRSGHWWQHGFVRRLELPEDADWKRTEASLINNETFIQVKIPKKNFDCGNSTNQGHDGLDKKLDSV